MGKAIAILFLVVGVWFSLEVQTKGLEGAFGGVFASSSGSEEPVDRASAAQRAGAAVDAAHRENEERYERMLEE
ncbi:MAG: hypothetical protein AAF430_13285 [Myxococcota bacterium]